MYKRMSFHLRSFFLENFCARSFSSCRFFSGESTSNEFDYDEKIHLKLSKSEPILEVHNVWLRHHCQCPLCFNHQTHQRIRIPSDLPNISQVSSYKFNDGILSVTWSDNHESHYDQHWLAKNTPKSVRMTGAKMPNTSCFAVQPLEQGSRATDNAIDPLETAVSFSDFMNKGSDGVRHLLSSIWRYGFGIVRDCPADFETTKKVITKVSHPQNTLFGDFSEWTSNLAHADTAYTNDFVHLHNDTTYFTEPVGLQIFHCLQHDGTGGINFLADGWKLAHAIFNQQFELYGELSTTLVPFQYIDTGKHHFHSNDTIFGHDKLSQRLFRIRYNPHDMAILNTLPIEKVPGFYKSLVHFSNLLEIKPLEIKLTPGLIIFLDNWRTLHGRSGFTGFRHLCGAYISRSDWLSRSRTLGIIP